MKKVSQDFEIFFSGIRNDFHSGSDGKKSASNTGDQRSIPGSERSPCLEKGMATRSSIRAWKMSWIKKTGGLQSMGHKESAITEHIHTSNPILKYFTLY